MQYLLIIASDESVIDGYSQAEAEATTGGVRRLGREDGRQGILRGGGERLRPIADATTVRVRNGETLTADGPFAETKEQLAGYFVVECDDLDEAIEAAGLLPAARYGSVEVRPIWAM